MNDDDSSSNQRFLSHVIQTFSGDEPGRSHNVMGISEVSSPRTLQASHFSMLQSMWKYQRVSFLEPCGDCASPADVPNCDDSDARSNLSVPDLLSDGWSDSGGGQDARDVEMVIVPGASVHPPKLERISRNSASSPFPDRAHLIILSDSRTATRIFPTVWRQRVRPSPQASGTFHPSLTQTQLFLTPHPLPAR